MYSLARRQFSFPRAPQRTSNSPGRELKRHHLAHRLFVDTEHLEASITGMNGVLADALPGANSPRGVIKS